MYFISETRGRKRKIEVDRERPSISQEEVHERGRETGPCREEAGQLQEDSCPYCFLSPCITTSNQNAPWIGPGQNACVENSGIRKNIYKRFWKCIGNLGGWDLPQYTEKKQRLGGPLYHVRQVMPECVLTLARDLYPNPKDMPYMDHKWEF